MITKYGHRVYALKSKNMKNIISTFICLAFCSLTLMQSKLVYSQDIENPIFKDGDRVCFVGNSITNNAQFYHFVNLYYATRYPNTKVVFFNCGISGDATQGVINRIQCDIFVHNPSWSVLMIGMNDVNRGLYAKSRQKEEGIEFKKEEALKVYRNNLEIIVRELIKEGRKLILETPSIYDQTSYLPTENLFGVNDALKKCADFIQVLAAKYNLPVVDYWSILSQINQTIHERDTTATIIGNDRVHPGTPGHFIMAYEFLKSTVGSEYVSKIVINRDAAESRQKSINCSIKNTVYRKQRISFDVKEESLPFPVSNEAKPALAMIPFTDHFNKELLQVADIPDGIYQLFIDNVQIGTFSSEKLAAGINLALLENTPQYQQALKIMHLFDEYRKVQAQRRNIANVEIYHLPDSMKNTSVNKREEYLKGYLEKRYKGTNAYEYHEGVFKFYISNKRIQAEIEKKLPKLIETVYNSNVPICHAFRLNKIQ
ncbi:MAG TPA: hypothetical protein DD458_24425 [Prolixibacteraceae bacterium]|nr:hypothetical protein [Marinilabiliales bacterium]HBL78383.1 hypothetical protein [Prolixibacteraceae bacterium]HCU60011.1 hypothetical protein [Prolixibacteraceae bacterium]